MWIKNTSGQKSASLTLSVIAFLLTAVWFLLSFLNIKILGWSPRQFEETAALAFLLPCLSLYFGRRASELKEIAVSLKKDKTKDEG